MNPNQLPAGNREMSQIIDIAKVKPEEIDQLQEISRSTFRETFGSVNTDENMQYYLENVFSATNILKELLQDDSEFYFARKDDNIIGYLKLNSGANQSEKLPYPSIEIARIYVLSGFHGQKIGFQLCDFAIRNAKGRGAHAIWLGVWEHNLKAIRFYEKIGFAVFGKHPFQLGDDLQTDLLMKLDLNPI